MVNSFQLAARFFWREWRLGQWYIMFFAVFIAVSGITTLNFYTERLKLGIQENNAKFLGGDLIVNSSTPIPIAWIDHAKQLKIRTAEVWSYPSVVTANNKMQLVNVMAVSDDYPLLGENQRPQKLTILVDERLLPLLSLTAKGVLTLGAAKFPVSHLLKNENVLFDTNWLIAPRVMISLSDVPATQTVLPGSRVNYRLLMTGDATSIQQMKAWITPQLTSVQRLLDVHNQEQRLTNIVDQIENFLQLGLLICLAMCCLAIVLSVQHYLYKHYNDVALLRSLGASQKQIFNHYLYKLIILALIAGVLGIIVGYIAQHVLEKVFYTYLQITLPAPTFKPVLFGFLLSIGLLFIFAYPMINALPKTSPLFLWRNEVSITKGRNSIYFIMSFIFLMLFIYSFTGFSILTLLFLNFMGVSVAGLYALSFLLLAIVKNNLSHTSGVWRRGLSQLVQYADNTSLQFISFTLIVMLIFVLSLLRTDLIQNWQASFEKNTPNYFAINIAQQDLIPLQNLFHDNQIKLEGIYPLVRGRLIQLNNQPIMRAIPESARENNALHRELNLTWMEKFPSDNKVVKGDAWSIHTKNVISVEKKLADDLHLKIGDILAFQVGEKVISAKIINFRTVSWTSFHPNFFVIFTPGMLDTFPVTYITSFYLTDSQHHFLNQIVQSFPNVTVIDVANLLKQIRDMINKMTYASQYLFLFALCAAILVFIASLQSSVDERKSAYQLWRILGASKYYIRQSILVEFGSIGVSVLLFSYVLAKLFIYLLEMKIFNF